MVKVWKTDPMASLKIGWAKYGQFSNRCWEIGSFSNRCLKIRSIFKQILKKYPWRRLRRRPQGAAGSALGRGVFKHLFEHEPYLAHPIFKIAIGLVFLSNNYHLVGDASYHMNSFLSVMYFLSTDTWQTIKYTYRTAEARIQNKSYEVHILSWYTHIYMPA